MAKGLISKSVRVVLAGVVAAVFGLSVSARASSLDRTTSRTQLQDGTQRAVHHRRHRRHHYYREVFTARPYADDLSQGDIAAGEDPVVRQAAVTALGNLNGTAVAVDPNTGRILAMVNQRLALSADYQPCSTTKVAVALAALDRGIINENTPVRISRRWSINLTEALARSNNSYFEKVGQKLGFDTLSQYERQFGLGELAGYNIPGEDPGSFPQEPGPGGVAKLSSFGEGIRISPLQLAAMGAAIANGGTLYYLQHPLTPEEVGQFQPKVKRQLTIGNLVPDVQDGMLAAVQHGTARLARLSDAEVLGKTGTCSRDGTRYGLFVSYMGTPGHPRMVLVVALRGNRAVYGPRAAEVAGQIYRSLDDQRYFADNHTTPLPAMSLPFSVH